MTPPSASPKEWKTLLIMTMLVRLFSVCWNLCSNSANQSDSTCCLWSYFPMWLTMEFIVGILLYDSDSKFFFSFLELLFTFYFFFTFLFRTAFYFFTFYFNFLFRITIFLFFYLCPIPCVYSNQQSTAFATIC